MAELRYQPTGWAHAYCYVVKWEPAQNKTGELYWKYDSVLNVEMG